MLNFSKRLIYSLSNKENRVTIDFSKTAPNQTLKLLNIESPQQNTKKSPVNIKSESSYNAYLSNTSLELGLKKQNCIAWIEFPGQEYQDHVIDAKFRLDNMNGYAAAGIIFRIMDEDSYYMALVSNKGYFRLDVVKNNIPKSLIAWSEISDFENTEDITKVSLSIITYGTSLIFIVNGKWLGEVNDNSITYGEVGFIIASYESDNGQTEKQGEYVCKAMLDYISIDMRVNTIEDCYKKWTDESNIDAKSRLRLAETFAVMDEPLKALDQINRAWKRRDEAISSVTTTYSEVRTRKELLLAARMSFRLGQYNEANEYIDIILEQNPDSAEGKVAYTEKLKVLTELNQFTQLKEFVFKNLNKINMDIDYYTLLGNCYWQLKEFKECAKTWDKAFKLNNENGIFAVNAANAYELSGNLKEALVFYINAGKIFLNQENNGELEVMIPKLTLLGKDNWEARSLIGKWAFSIEDYDRCVLEFETADKLRRALKPQPKADPALFYLLGLVYYIKEKTKMAVRLLEKAVKLAPDYELFKTKLEEIKLKLNENN